jgi:hypothetical protein
MIIQDAFVTREKGPPAGLAAIAKSATDARSDSARELGRAILRTMPVPRAAHTSDGRAATTERERRNREIGKVFAAQRPLVRMLQKVGGELPEEPFDAQVDRFQEPAPRPSPTDVAWMRAVPAPLLGRASRLMMRAQEVAFSPDAVVHNEWDEAVADLAEDVADAIAHLGVSSAVIEAWLRGSVPGAAKRAAARAGMDIRKFHDLGKAGRGDDDDGRGDDYGRAVILSDLPPEAARIALAFKAALDRMGPRHAQEVRQAPMFKALVDRIETSGLPAPMRRAALSYLGV